MISSWRACGALPRTVSRRIPAQAVSTESVKCRTQSLCPSSAAGTSILQPVAVQVAITVRAGFGIHSILARENPPQNLPVQPNRNLCGRDNLRLTPGREVCINIHLGV